jgi:hypothetical protein
MKAYKSKFVGAALLDRRWSLVGRQRQSESRVGSAGKPEADLVACLNCQTRMSYLNMLKAQIDAGIYHVDSRALARKMLQAEHCPITETSSAVGSGRRRD